MLHTMQPAWLQLSTHNTQRHATHATGTFAARMLQVATACPCVPSGVCKGHPAITHPHAARQLHAATFWRDNALLGTVQQDLRQQPWPGTQSVMTESHQYTPEPGATAVTDSNTARTMLAAQTHCKASLHFTSPSPGWGRQHPIYAMAGERGMTRCPLSI